MNCQCGNNNVFAKGFCRKCYEHLSEILEQAEDYEFKFHLTKKFGPRGEVEPGKTIICSGCGKWKFIHVHNVCFECFFNECSNWSER